MISSSFARRHFPELQRQWMSISTEHAAIRFLKMAQNQTKQKEIEKKENPVLCPLYTWCVRESGDFKNVMNSKCCHLFSLNTYEHNVYIKEFRFFQFQNATGWTVRGSNPGGGEIFRTRPDRP
jgi:hypothetical protein